jgi:predicted RNase H-like HicB family nuclease
LCPELDVASQGDTVEEAKANLQEAIELFFEHAAEREVETRLKGDIFITNVQVAVG